MKIKFNERKTYQGVIFEENCVYEVSEEKGFADRWLKRGCTKVKEPFRGELSYNRICRNDKQVVAEDLRIEKELQEKELQEKEIQEQEVVVDEPVVEEPEVVVDEPVVEEPVVEEPVVEEPVVKEQDEVDTKPKRIRKSRARKSK